MLITENQNKAMWTKMLTEQFHVEDNEKLNWVSDYAQTHAMFEANLGAHAVATATGVQPVTVPAGAPGGGPGSAAVFHLRPGPPDAPRRLRCGVGRVSGQRALGRCGRAVGHRRAHHRVWLHPEPRGRAG